MVRGNVYQRINEVRKSVNYAQRDKTVSTGGSGGYKAVTHDAVTALIRNHLIEYGIVVEPKVVESRVVDAGKTQGGTTIIRYEARFDVAFVNEDNPDDRAIVALDAHANDSSDKAPGKALSYATKNAMLKLFSIETGEDDESRVESYEDFNAVTREQITEINRLIEERVNDLGKFSKWLEASVGTDMVDQIPQRKFDLVAKQLQAMPVKKAAKRVAADASKDADSATDRDAPRE